MIKINGFYVTFIEVIFVAHNSRQTRENFDFMIAVLFAMARRRVLMPMSGDVNE